MKSFLMILSLLLITTTSWAFPMQYKAQQDIVSAGTTHSNTVYFDNGKMRIDADIAGMKTTTIMRPDKNVAYQIMPNNLYLEIPLDGVQKMMANFYDESSVKRENMGTETVDGKTCSKFKLNASGVVSFLWVEQGTEIPVKMESADNKFAVNWRNVALGAQDPALFEVPANYQKINVGGLMNDINGMVKDLGKNSNQLQNQLSDAVKNLKNIGDQIKEPATTPSANPGSTYPANP